MFLKQNVCEHFNKFVGSITPGKYFFVLFIFSICIFGLGLEARELWGGDETRVAGIAAEMSLDKQYLVPQLNDKNFLEYPNLYYMFTAWFFNLCGITDMAAKMVSALAAMIGAWVVFGLCRTLGFSGLTALLSGVMLSSSAQYWSNGRVCMVDILLAFWVMAAVWMFALMTKSESKKSMFFFSLLFGSAMAGGCMTKGLIGMVLPLSGVMIFLLIKTIMERKLNLKYWGLSFLAVLFGFGLVGVWVYLLYHHSGWAAVEVVVWKNNFGRFFGFYPEHAESFFYYLGKLPGLFQPWTILLIGALWFHFWRIYKFRAMNSIFISCVLLVPVLLLCISTGKRQVYLLPLYGFEAIFIASAVTYFLAGDFVSRRVQKLREIILNYGPKLLLLSLGISGIVFAAVILWAKLPLMSLWCPGLLMVFALVSWRLLSKSAYFDGFFGLFITLALFFVSIDYSFMAYKSQDSSYRKHFEMIAETVQKKSGQLYSHKLSERVVGASYFYLWRYIPGIDDRLSNLTASDVVISGDISGINSDKYDIKKYDKRIFVITMKPEAVK